MKKFYTALYAIAAASMAFAADVVPNATMDDWSDCTPWTSNGNTRTCGTTPAQWTISQVIGISGTGATIVGERTDGYNSENAAKIYNSSNSLVKTQIVPGYITLGTTWSTSVMGSKNDGGTFGGVEWGKRPDALAFMYKRTHGDANADEVASVVAYLWKGQWSQADVPGNIVLGNTPTKCTMVNRDRNILGMETTLGGAVTKSDDAELIAKINTSITGNAADWAQGEFAFEYTSTATPAMMNIIFCAGDYYSTTPGKGNTLVVDDVKYVYYSRLQGVKVDGTSIPDFSANTYEYTVDMEMPAEASIQPVALGQSGMSTVSVSCDTENYKVTIVCTNAEGADIDGESTHTYTLQFNPPFEPEGEYSRYDGTLNIDMSKLGMDAAEAPASVYIQPSGENQCSIAIYDLKLEGESLGDIIVTDVTVTPNEDGTKTYNGTADNITLLGGVISASAVITGTEDADGHLSLTINVSWSMPNDIVVTFNGTLAYSAITSVEADNDAPAQYYDLRGIRHNADALAPGLYIKRQGTTSTKVVIR